MKKAFLSLLALGTFGFIVLSGGVLWYASTHDMIVDPTPMPKKEISAPRLFELVNEWRLENGHNEYKEDTKTCDLASKRLADMKQSFSHDIKKVQIDCGIKGCRLGENLSEGYQTDEEVLNAWLNSPTHKKNLDDNFEFSCIRCDGYYCVHIFTKYN